MAARRKRSGFESSRPPRRERRAFTAGFKSVEGRGVFGTHELSVPIGRSSRSG